MAETPGALRETISYRARNAPMKAANSCLPGRARATIRTDSSTRCSARHDAGCVWPPLPASKSWRSLSRAAGPEPRLSPACRIASRSLPCSARRTAPACAMRLALAVLLAAACRAGAAAPRAPTRFRSSRPNCGSRKARSSLNADFEFALNPTLEEALEKEHPLYFVARVRARARALVLAGRKVAQTAVVYRVSYNALTAAIPRRQRAADADVQLAGRGRALHRPDHVAAGRARDAARQRARSYDAAVRLRLDVNQLPKPFQVDALASREMDARSRLGTAGLHAVSYARCPASADCAGSCWSSASLSAIAAVPARHGDGEHRRSLRSGYDTLLVVSTACWSAS